MISQNRTKIIATIGPASSSPKILEAMIDAGMDVVRFNFSHGKYSEFDKWLNLIRKMSKKKNQPIAILQDLQGPRIRLSSDIPKKGIVLEEKSVYALGYGKYREGFIPVDYKGFMKDIRVGTKVLLSDGMIEAKVAEKKKNFVKIKIVLGGKVFPRKGVNIPHVKISLPALTEKDKKDLDWGIKNGVDYISLSFVQDASDVKKLRQLIYKKDKKSGIKVIAKIENPKALRNIKSIFREADGVMIARGDLGIEIPSEKLPVAQKEIILEALKLGKPVITATQMMESMIKNPVPTRAESSDVANAMLDGTDATMLSGETSVGKYPVRIIDLMNKIIRETEKEIFITRKLHFENILDLGVEMIKEKGFNIAPSYAVGDAVNIMSSEVGAKYIIAATLSGSTARFISRSRPKTKILALSPDQKVVNQLALVWGVRSFLFPMFNNTEELIKNTVVFLKKGKLVKRGDKVVIVCSHPLNKSGSTNLIKIEEIR